MMRIAGRSKDGYAKGISTDEEGRPRRARGQLQEKVIFDNEVATHGKSLQSDDLELAGVKNVCLMVINRHNIPLMLKIQRRPSAITSFTTDVKTLDMDSEWIEVPSSYHFEGANLITKDQYPVLNGNLDRIRLSIKTETEPSRGNFTVLLSYVEG